MNEEKVECKTLEDLRVCFLTRLILGFFSVGFSGAAEFEAQNRCEETTRKRTAAADLRLNLLEVP